MNKPRFLTPHSAIARSRQLKNSTSRRLTVALIALVVAGLAASLATPSAAHFFAGTKPAPPSPAALSTRARVPLRPVTPRKSASEHQADDATARGRAELNVERRGHAAVALGNGKVLIIGGENERGLVKESELFDLASKSFSLAAELISRRTDAVAIRLPDGRVMVLGGRNSKGELRSTEIYDSESNSFTRGPKMVHARAGHTATALADGRILLAGGNARGSAEIFDPSGLKFSRVQSRMQSPRSAHSAILLKSGKVLIAGGVSTAAGEAGSGEVFDPETLSFSATRNKMHGARTRPMLRVLPDGKVQVIGGDDARSMEMFNVEGGYFTARASLLPDANSQTGIAEVMRAKTQAGLFHKTDRESFKLGRIPFADRSRDRFGTIQDLMSREETLADVLDRSEHTITELPGSGGALSEVIVTGGASGSGKVLGTMFALESSPATVTTDKTDYQPGDTVIITGTGWEPSETVRLTLHRDNGSDDTVLSGVADQDGNISNSDYLVQWSDLDVAFLLTAVGGSSGFTAQTTFTDRNPQTITVGVQSPPSITAGNAANYTVGVLFGGSNDPCTVTLNVTGLPVGASFLFSPDNQPIGTGSGAQTVNRSLQINTTASGPSATPPGTYTFTVTGTNGVGCQGPGPTAGTGTLVVAAAQVAPEITCPADILVNQASGQCSASVSFSTTATGTPTPTVECKIGATVITSPHTFPVGTTTVTCTATNSAGSDTCTFNVTVKDTEAPTCNLPTNITQNNDTGVCGAIVSYTATASDNCPGATILCTPASGSTFAVGTTTVACTASDASADSPDTNCSFTVTVKDTESPTCTLPTDITQNNDAGQCGAIVSYTATASDNCPGATILCAPASGSTFAVGTTTVECTASDASPDSPDTNCNFTVTVKDTEAPVCNLPSPITQNNDTGVCGAIVSYTATASDNCPGATILCTPASGATFAVGTTTVECTASDASADSPDTNCSFTVTVKDTDAPTCNLPADITQNNDAGQCSAIVSYTATASDNCPGATILCSPASGSTFAVGTTTVECTASDASPDSPDTNCSFTVTVKDTEAPTCNLPDDLTQSNDAGQCSAIVSYTATASDNCPVAEITCSPASGSTFAVGTTTVECTATDGSTDSPDTNCSFTVTVKDTEAPTCNLPADITQNNDAGQCGAIVSYTASASDNCPGANISCSPPSGSSFAVGTTTVNCTASDASADSPDTSCSFMVTINDTEAPTCNLPPNITQNNTAGQCGATVSYTATASDNCPGANISCSPASGSFFAVGTTTVSCTATDASLNSPNTNCSFTVTVKDVEAPTCNLPSNIVIACSTSSGGAMVSYTATASDNCAGANITCNPASGSIFAVGVTTVNCVATDASPDSSNTNCSFTVSVNFNFIGFFQPVDNLPVTNAVKAGQSVPLKFQITCGTNFISDLGAVTSIQTINVGCVSGLVDDLIITDDSGASGLHYDFTANQFVYSWKTQKQWANSCRRIVLTLRDGSVHEAYFQFKK